MAENDEGRECPYCKKILHHPYWQHVQKEHPDEYAKNETWISLYKDYIGMGMDQEMSIMVISELFNQTVDDVKSYLKKNKVL
ncbi:MAG: hypothetical protein GF353_29045 [Candidatus Lokiarchaeota archaeon]|nr:hypothetical protein [Candidatus Lokiarchaeota archaeon]